MNDAPRYDSSSSGSEDAYHNVGDRERTISLLAGAGSLLVGLRRGGTHGLLMSALGGYLAYRGVTGHCPAYSYFGMNTSRPGDSLLSGRPTSLHLTTGVTIERSPEELYQVWRDFTYLPTFMRYLNSVTPTGDSRTHWIADLPVAGQLEWDSEVVQDDPNERIAWRSVEDSDIEQRGEIRFQPAPGDRGTEVELDLHYAAPGGQLTKAAGSLINAVTEEVVREDLRRFKHLMESGEIPTGARTAP